MGRSSSTEPNGWRARSTTRSPRPPGRLPANSWNCKCSGRFGSPVSRGSFGLFPCLSPSVSLRIPVMKTGDKNDDIQLSAVEDHDGILTIRGGGPRRDWNGIHYKQGMSAKNVGTTKLSANIATIPPGGVAYAHIHVGFELILYILEGKVRHEFGPGLKQVLENEAGDFIYIKPGVPHEVFNMSDTEPVVAVVARSDADEWAHIVTYDRNTGRLGDRLDA